MELPYNTPINIVCYQRKVHRINKFCRVHLKKHTTCITLKHSPSPKRGVYVRREKNLQITLSETHLRQVHSPRRKKEVVLVFL